MLKSVLWKKAFFEHPSPKPFSFVTGMRVGMEEGDYCGKHSHLGLEVVYHQSGQGTTMTGGESIRFGSGSVVIYGPAQLHDQSAETSTVDLCIHLMIPAAIGMKLKEALYIAGMEDPVLADEIRRLAMAAVPSETVDRRILDYRASALFLGLLRAADSSPDDGAVSGTKALHVRRAEDFIRDNYATIESVGEIAHHVGVSHDYLRHVFKLQRGRSVVSHLNGVRLAQAKLLLIHSPMPMKQVATACGFRDEYYFSAVFRKRFGLSPGAYRAARSGKV